MISLFHHKHNVSKPSSSDTQNDLIAKIGAGSKDFEFVQADKSIHDVRFQTKPTSFFKDAMSRFAKNRSSVIASVILGVLIGMAVLVPVLDTSNIDDSQTFQQYLPPRWQIFAGTGFLDGTVNFDNIVGYDTTGTLSADTDLNNVYPVDMEQDAIVDGTLTRAWSTSNAASEYGYGGALGFATTTHTSNSKLFTPTAKFKSSKDYSLSLVFDQDLCKSASIPGTYRIFASVSYDNSTYTDITLRDFSSDYSDVTIDGLSTLIKNGNPDSSSEKTEFNLAFGIELQTNTTYESEDVSVYPSVYIKSFTFPLAEGQTDTTWSLIGFSDANACKLRDTTTDSDTAALAWQVSGYGSKSVRNVNLVTCSFRYDKYKVVYGDKTHVWEFDNYIKPYIDKGWMTLDPQDINSFQILNDAKCPIRSIQKIEIKPVSTTNPDGSTTIINAYEVTCVVSTYRYLGLDSIPNFIFGTNGDGWDYFKFLFMGLRTSLLLGVLCAVINISFGLVWGSISGYFGGWTDIAMERFTEILGGVPWIVIMTICLLNLGQNFWTFLLALCLTGWLGVAGTTRAQFYRFKGREYVLASRTLGASDWRLIFKHILPNAIGTIVTGSVLMIPAVIFDEATIAYLGLGLKGMKSFGVALSDAQNDLQAYPYLIVSGSIIVSLLMISFNLFGNGLRDAFNPSLKGVQE